jgi:hypothetical protein
VPQKSRGTAGAQATPVSRDANIERHVPALPYRREVERLHELCRSLAIYRMVFGQSRQEDLIQYLRATVPEEQQASISEQLKIDLSPANYKARSEYSGREQGMKIEADSTSTTTA